jgi:hypothetical protein
MGRKRAFRAQIGKTRDVPVLCGFPDRFRNRFTLALRQPITIIATAQASSRQALPAHRQAGAAAEEQKIFEKRERRAYSHRAWNEGVGEHVRTRFHNRPSGNQAVGPVKLRTTCDPHRTKKTSFFCRIDLWREQAPSNDDPAV